MAYRKEQQQLTLDLTGGSLVEARSPTKRISEGFERARSIHANTLDFWVSEMHYNPALATPIGEGRRRSDGQLFSVNMGESGNPWPTLREAILESRRECTHFHAKRLEAFCEWMGERGAHTALTEIAIGVQIYRGLNGWYAACSKTIQR